MKPAKTRAPSSRSRKPEPPAPDRGVALAKRLWILLVGGALAIAASLHLSAWSWGVLSIFAVLSGSLLTAGFFVSDARLNAVFTGCDNLDCLEILFHFINF